MSSINHSDDASKQSHSKSEQEDAKAQINKRLILQHLAQKKIKKIKAKLNINQAKK